MIDTHCHLTDPRLLEQLDAVVSRARDAGVDRLITIATTPADARAALSVCVRFSNVRCAIGVHPNHSHEIDDSAIDELREMAASPAVVAIGEMGLDYFHAFADRAVQRRMFEQQLQLADELDKPVVIHSREAVADTLDVLADFPNVPAVFHCFTDVAAEVKAILDAGHMISFTGPITYKRNDALREVVRNVPRDRLMVETDSPYLSPEPMRKFKTNEPAWVMHVAAAVAACWGVSVEEVDAVTTGNAERFFSLV